jgi:hypothetical protein
MENIFNWLEAVQSHGGVLFMLLYLTLETKYLRRDVDNILERRKDKR